MHSIRFNSELAREGLEAISIEVCASVAPAEPDVGLFSAYIDEIISVEHTSFDYGLSGWRRVPMINITELEWDQLKIEAEEFLADLGNFDYQGVF